MRDGGTSPRGTNRPPRPPGALQPEGEASPGPSGVGAPPRPRGAVASLERPSPDSMNDSLPPSGAWSQGLESIIPCHLPGAPQATKPLSRGVR